MKPFLIGLLAGMLGITNVWAASPVVLGLFTSYGKSRPKGDWLN